MKCLIVLVLSFNVFAQNTPDNNALIDKKISELVELEKRYENTKLQWLSRLNLKKEKYNSLVAETKAALKKNNQANVFVKVNNYWKELARTPFNLNENSDTSLDLQAPKQTDKGLIESTLDSASRKSYIQLHNKLVQKYKLLSQTFEVYKKEQVKAHFNRLVKVARLRAKLLQKISITNVPSYSASDLVIDVVTEIKVVPYRLFGIFFNRFSYIKEKLSIGFEGYVELLKELVWFVFLLGFIILFKYVIIYIQKQSDAFREKLIKKEETAINKIAALILQKIDPILKPLLWLILFDYFEGSLAKTSLEEVNFVIPYIKYYFCYAILKVFIAAILTGVVTRRKSYFSKDFKLKTKKYSKIISFIFLFTESFLFAVKSTTSQGLIYIFINDLRFYIYAFTFILISYKWREDIRKALESLSNKALIDKIIIKLKFSIVYSPVLLVIYFYIVFKNKMLIALNFLNFSNDISTMLAEKKIQSNEELSEDDVEVNRSYKKLFLLMPSETDADFIPRDSKNIDKILKDIDDWKNDPNEEHSIAIYGEQGVGKTSVLNKVLNLSNGLNSLELKFNEKLTTGQAVYEHLAKCLGLEDSELGLSNIIKVDRDLPKTIIVVDDIHNLFLSKVGGMGAYKEFMKIINLNTENIFWIASFNKYSWQYVDAVFERPHFFRNVYPLGEWTVNEIKDLIISRHEKSKFDIEYSDLISAIKGEDELDSFAYVESKYFKILTNLSDGNPKLAIQLWLSSLKFNYYKKTITVSLPKVNRSIDLSKYNDNTHFVLAELVKHQNLSIKETCDVVNLSIGSVTQTYKVAQENHLVTKENGRYRLTPNGQYIVVNFLRQRNFIYGN